MGHSHSSSHKRLKSISSTRNCVGEFTEVIDLEFSDAGTIAESTSNKLTENNSFSKSSLNKIKNNSEGNMNKLNSVTEETESPIQIQFPKDLLTLEDQVREIEEKINNMSSDELFVYFPTFKDDLHNCWQKVYSVKEQNAETKLKKHKVIDNIRELLRKLNAMLQRREFRN